MKRLLPLLLALLFVLCNVGCSRRLESVKKIEAETKEVSAETIPKIKEEKNGEKDVLTNRIPVGTKGECALKVVSFNLNTYYEGYTDEKNWHVRKDALCAYILSLNADVICLQETPEIYRDYFAEKFFGVYLWEHENHNMVLYRADRFEKLDFTVFYYGEDSTVKAPAYDASMERNFSMTHLREKSSGAEFYAVATHFDHKGLKARIFAAKQLIATLSQCTIPYVLCGDFNSNEETYVYRDLTSQIKDAQKIALVTDSGNTFNKWGERPDEGLPIDFIFVSPVNLSVDRFQILRDRWGDNFLYSDHYAISAEMRLAY